MIRQRDVIHAHAEHYPGKVPAPGLFLGYKHRIFTVYFSTGLVVYTDINALFESITITLRFRLLCDPFILLILLSCWVLVV